MKRLIGKTEIEDALKRLDKLTNEEVRMVTAQVLKATHTADERVAHVDEGVIRVDDRVARVDEGVTRVDGRVAGIDDRVAHVDERVAGIEGRVTSVDDTVKAIDDKVAMGIDGAQPSLISHQENMSDPDVLRRKRDKGTHTAGRRRHGSSQTLVIFFCVDIGVQAQASSQGTNYARTFSNGSLRRIHLSTTTLPVVPITRKHLSGFSVGVSSPNGSPMGRFCGSTESVRCPDLSTATVADGHLL